MHIPKKYGEARIDRCPFCRQHATTTNKQWVPVCSKHHNDTLENLKCVCGSYLYIKSGKFGAYFHCMKCGNMNMKRVLEINTIRPNYKPNPAGQKSNSEKNPREITIRSDDPRYFD